MEYETQMKFLANFLETNQFKIKVASHKGNILSSLLSRAIYILTKLIKCTDTLRQYLPQLLSKSTLYLDLSRMTSSTHFVWGKANNKNLNFHCGIGSYTFIAPRLYSFKPVIIPASNNFISICVCWHWTTLGWQVIIFSCHLIPKLALILGSLAPKQPRRGYLVSTPSAPRK